MSPFQGSHGFERLLFLLLQKGEKTLSVEDLKKTRVSLPKEPLVRKRRSKWYLIEGCLAHDEILKQFQRMYRQEICLEVRKLRRMFDDGDLYKLAREI